MLRPSLQPGDAGTAECTLTAMASHSKSSDESFARVRIGFAPLVGDCGHLPARNTHALGPARGVSLWKDYEQRQSGFLTI